MLMERLIEQAARASDVDPAELRERNLAQPDRFPYPIATGEMIDSGNYPLLLAEARERCCYDGLLAARDRRRAAGEICGVGLALYVEPSGQGWESAAISLDAGGMVVVATGATSQGQGAKPPTHRLLPTRLASIRCISSSGMAILQAARRALALLQAAAPPSAEVLCSVPQKNSEKRPVRAPQP
jgi:aerobic carbon-monoxide dehydrogenase large subunit